MSELLFNFISSFLSSEEDFNPEDYDDADDPETLEEEERLEQSDRIDHAAEIAELEAVCSEYICRLA